MKICIFGAGAIGGYMGVKLAEAGADVSLVARGPHLAAMGEKGLTLIPLRITAVVTMAVTPGPAPAVNDPFSACPWERRNRIAFATVWL